MKVKKIPMRSCVVTREKCEKRDLIRIVRTPEGEVKIDLNGKMNGRGAYIKKDVTVVDKEKVTSWKEVFRDTIGGGIIHDHTNQYYLEIMTGSGKGIQTADVGEYLIENNFNFIKDEDVVRINLVKFPTEKNTPRSWVIIRV